MMNQVIKSRWVKALRSGRYKQTVGVLASPKINGTMHHCCLGVLERICKLPENENGDEKLGRAALKITGITDKTQMKLAAMNDEDGKTFKEIADYIEAKL